MAKFKFRLATLLRLHEAARDERRTELAEAYRVDDVLRGQLDDMTQQSNRLKLLRREAAGPGSVDVDRIVEAQRYSFSLQAQRRHIQQQRETVATEIERRRQNLVEANRQVRVLEKLREKQSDRHRQKEGRLENKRLDEVAGQLAARENAL